MSSRFSKKESKVLSWDMYDKRYVGNVNQQGTWFDFAIIITKYPNKTYDVDTWFCDNILTEEVTHFDEPSYSELKIYNEYLLKEYLKKN